MSASVDEPELDAANPASWAALPFETAFSLSKDKVEQAFQSRLSKRPVVGGHTVSARKGGGCDPGPS